MPVLGAAMKCIQLMLFLLSFAFLLVGTLLIVIGAVVLGNYNDFESFLETPHFKPAEIMIACGALLVFISFIGCVGAIKKSIVMVNMYAILLFIVLIMEIVGAFIAFSMRCNVFDDIETSMEDALYEYNSSDSIREAWDFTQRNLQCCGVHEPRDWASHDIDGPVVHIEGHFKFTVPYSCCENQKECRIIYERGCLNVLGSYASDVTLLMVYIGAGIAVVQLFSVCFASSLAKGIRRAKIEQEMDRQQNRQRIYEQALSRHTAPPYLHVSSASEA